MDEQKPDIEKELDRKHERHMVSVVAIAAVVICGIFAACQAFTPFGF